MIGLPVVCSSIPPLREIGGKEVCFIQLSESPQQIAETIIHYVSGHHRSRFFRRVIKDFTWDNILMYRLMPLVTEVTGRQPPARRRGSVNQRFSDEPVSVGQ